MHPNTTKRNKGWVCGPMGVDWVRSLWKHLTRLCSMIFCIHCTSLAHFAPSFMQMVQNAPKHYETHQNMSLLSYGVDRVDLLQKILTHLCGLNFCINYNSSARVEPSIVKQRNGPKCRQTLRNKTKHRLGSNGGGSIAFVVKKSDTTSWHELSH